MNDELRLTAREWAAMMHHPLRDRGYQRTPLGGSVADYLAWKELSGAAERTLETYEWVLARFTAHHPHLELDQVDSRALVTYLGGVNAPSRRLAASVLRDFFKWARQWQHVPANPMDLVPKMRQTPTKVIETFSPEEIEALIYCQPDLRDRALVMLLADTGIRKGEARQLQRRHAAPDTLRLTVTRGKGGKARVLPLSPRVASALSELDIFDDVQASDYLWYRTKVMPQGTRHIHRDKMIVGSGFVAWWNRMIENADVAYRSPHVMRHTFATRWLRDGGPLPELSRMLGHSSIKTTVDTYAHLAVEDIETAFSKLLKTRGEA